MSSLPAHRCYHPDIWTETAQIAQDAGWKVVTGEQAVMCVLPLCPTLLLSPRNKRAEPTRGIARPNSWQGIEQQLLWLECTEEDLPIADIVETVSKQMANDKASGAEPPLE